MSCYSDNFGCICREQSTILEGTDLFVLVTTVCLGSSLHKVPDIYRVAACPCFGGFWQLWIVFAILLVSAIKSSFLPIAFRISSFTVISSIVHVGVFEKEQKSLYTERCHFMTRSYVPSMLKYREVYTIIKRVED